MFAGIDIASERHVLARLNDAGAAIGKPITITEDCAGYDALLAVSCTRFLWTPICPRRDRNDDVRHEADGRSFGR